jgi:hypothetical protein
MDALRRSVKGGKGEASDGGKPARRTRAKRAPAKRKSAKKAKKKAA